MSCDYTPESSWRFGSDHVPFFSWVMAVGEPCQSSRVYIFFHLSTSKVGSIVSGTVTNSSNTFGVYVNFGCEKVGALFVGSSFQFAPEKCWDWKTTYFPIGFWYLFTCELLVSWSVINAGWCVDVAVVVAGLYARRFMSSFFLLEKSCPRSR